MAIINIVEEHEDYDWRFCHNGGSYYQPTYAVTFDDGKTFVINDSSCGDFGSRITVTVDEYRADYGSMLEEDEEWSDIPAEYAPYLAEIREAVGYNIPTVKDFGVAN